MKLKKIIIGSLFVITISLYASCDYDEESRDNSSNNKLLFESSYADYLINRIKSSSINEYQFGDLGNPEDYDSFIREPDFERDTLSVDSLPSAFNWADRGAVTVAKDQGGCGSCWAFAATGAFESKIIINFHTIFDLSEQQMVSCNTEMSGCSGGSSDCFHFWDVDYGNHGPMQESCTGYCACDQFCRVLHDDYNCTEMDYRIKDWYTVSTSDINNIKKSIYNDGPTYFRFNVYSDFISFWDNGQFKSVYLNRGGILRGGHAVLIIGWDDTKNAWLCKNSWGAKTGPNGNGTFWIAYNGHSNNLGFGMVNCTVQNVGAKIYSTPCQIPGQNVDCCE